MFKKTRESIYIFIHKIYKLCVSPFLGDNCKFAPSCSDYALEAVKEYGLIKGGLMSCWRVCKCNPFHPVDFDPVRKNKDNYER